MRYSHLLVAAVAVVLLAATPAFGDTFTFDITTGNAAIAGYTGPYATVVINLTSSTTATITFTSLTNNGNIYLMGGNSSVAVNVNATSWTLGTVTGSNAGTGFSSPSYSNGGSGTSDGFGVFNQQINAFDGYSHSADTITFTLTDTSGTWASAASVLIGNANNDIAASHIFVTSSPAYQSNGALATGFASVPEPSSVALLLSTLVGLPFMRRILQA